MGKEKLDDFYCSRWAISNLGSLGQVGIDGNVFDLVNVATSRAHKLILTTGGISVGPLPWSASFSPTDYSYFTTSHPVNFEDFNKKGARFTSANLLLYSICYLTIWDGSAYGGSKLADVRMSGLGPSLPGLGVGHGVSALIYGSGTPEGPVMTSVVHQTPPDPTEVTMRINRPLQFTIPSDVLFPFDRPKPTEVWLFDAKGTAELEKAAKKIRANPYHRPVIYGYSDSIGPDDYNKALSERRANAVAQWLRTTGGVKVHAVYGLGKKDPVVPNTDTAATKANIDAQAKNRRIEIFMHT